MTIEGDVLELAGRIITIIIGTTVLIGLMVRMLLLPWLRENLVKPVEETHTQVTVNSHKSDPATLLDTIHTIQAQVDGLTKSAQEVAIASAAVKASTDVIHTMWDHHLQWSEAEVGRLWQAVDKKEDKHV